jgi:hypothetical protein
LGKDALGAVTTGFDNVAIGNQAGDTITTGDGNICIGRSVDLLAADIDQLSIGNGGTSWIYGDAGDIGIGYTAAAITEKLHVDGNILASGTITELSDLSVKDDVVVIEDALRKVKKLRGVTYTRNDKETDRRFSGVIAQEVENVLPEVVGETNGLKTVSYGNMVGLLIEAVKELSEEVKELKKELKEHKDA